MFIAILTLIISLYVAGIAGWFSIVGLMSIFSGYAFSAMCMGIGIEAGKVIGVSWLYRNWDSAPFKLRYFTLTCTIIAMLLTSGGIFGYLSKAHLEQQAPLGTLSADIKILDYKISREQKRIDNATVVLDQLDSTVNTLIKNEKISSKNGARDVRESQRQERAELNKDIEEARKAIDNLTQEKMVKELSLKGAELDVGPIKYISKVINNDDSEASIENSVTKVIFLILLAFDPFAIALLMCANYSFMKWTEDRKNKKAVDTVTPSNDGDNSHGHDKMDIDDETPLLNPIVEDEPTQEDIVTDEVIETIKEEPTLNQYDVGVAEPIKVGIDGTYEPKYTEDGKQARLQALMERVRKGEIGWLNMKTK